MIEDIKELLESINVKPSVARVKVMEYLVKYSEHPTVEEIYQQLKPEIPTLSKTTVYNALELFAEAQLVKVINVGDNESRYDADTSIHGHFKCNRCGNVYDFWFDEKEVRVRGLEGFRVEDKNFYCRGWCHHCLEKFPIGNN